MNLEGIVGAGLADSPAAPEKENQAFCLEEHRKLPKPQGNLSAPGRARTEPVSASISPLQFLLQTSDSGNFQSTTGRMNKYLVTSLKNVDLPELLCKITKFMEIL